jgi:hypothetical protein
VKQPPPAQPLGSPEAREATQTAVRTTDLASSKVALLYDVLDYCVSFLMVVLLYDVLDCCVVSCCVENRDPGGPAPKIFRQKSYEMRLMEGSNSRITHHLLPHSTYINILFIPINNPQSTINLYHQSFILARRLPSKEVATSSFDINPPPSPRPSTAVKVCLPAKRLRRLQIPRRRR